MKRGPQILKKSQAKTLERLFREAVDDFGGSDHVLTFRTAHMDPGDYAQIDVDEETSQSTITWALEWPEAITPAVMESVARHEALHLFFAPIDCLAERRFVTERELKEAQERMVRRLARWVGWKV